MRNKKFSSSTGSTIVGNSAFYMSNVEERKPARPLSSHGLTTDAIGTLIAYVRYSFHMFLQFLFILSPVHMTPTDFLEIVARAHPYNTV